MGQAQVYQYKVSALSTVLASAQVLFMAFMDRLQCSASTVPRNSYNSYTSLQYKSAPRNSVVAAPHKCTV